MDVLQHFKIREPPLEFYSSGKVFINSDQGMVNKCAASVCKVKPAGLRFNSASIFLSGYTEKPAVS